MLMEKIIVLGIIATVFISGSITPGTLVGEAAELTTSTTPAGITSKNTDEHFKHSPELSVFPDSGAAGITSKASGSGFHHLKTIKISFDGTVVATTTTDKEGNFTDVSFIVPASSLLGPHKVSATDGHKTASTTFTVNRPIQDLAVVNRGDITGNVSILLGDGTGSFGAATNFAAGTYPISLAIGDFNDDGKQDLVVVNLDSNNVSKLLGDGTGSFGAATNFAVGISPFSVAVGDFNGDGKQDLAVRDLIGNFSILLGDGTGSFLAATDLAVGTARHYSVAVGDFNGDGKQDLVVSNQDSNNVSILLGDGTGSFGAATNFAVGTLPFFITVGDFNEDCKQ